MAVCKIKNFEENGENSQIFRNVLQEHDMENYEIDVHHL